MKKDDVDAARARLERKLGRLLKATNPHMDGLQVEGMVEGMTTEQIEQTLQLHAAVEKGSIDGPSFARSYGGATEADYDSDDAVAGQSGWVRSDDGESWLKVGSESFHYRDIVSFKNLDTVLPRTTGAEMLKVLIQSPGQEFDSLELDRLAGGEITENQQDWAVVDLPVGDDVEEGDTGDVGISVGGLAADLNMIDREGVTQARAELKALQAQLTEAERGKNAKEVARLKGDIAALKEWLKQGTNVRGEPRPIGPHERARVNAHNAIKRTIGILGRDDQALAAHLGQAVTQQDGTWSYRAEGARVRREKV